MGVLGDKLLAAGAVTQDDVARLHRQEVIQRENERRKREQQRHQEQDAELKRRLDGLAQHAASVSVKVKLLKLLGFSEEECIQLMSGKPPFELMFRLGAHASLIAEAVTDPELITATAELKQHFLNDKKFVAEMTAAIRKDMRR